MGKNVGETFGSDGPHSDWEAKLGIGWGGGKGKGHGTEG